MKLTLIFLALLYGIIFPDIFKPKYYLPYQSIYQSTYLTAIQGSLGSAFLSCYLHYFDLQCSCIKKTNPSPPFYGWRHEWMSPYLEFPFLRRGSNESSWFPAMTILCLWGCDLNHLVKCRTSDMWPRRVKSPAWICNFEISNMNLQFWTD